MPFAAQWPRVPVSLRAQRPSGGPAPHVHTSQQQRQRSTEDCQDTLGLFIGGVNCSHRTHRTASPRCAARSGTRGRIVSCTPLPVRTKPPSRWGYPFVGHGHQAMHTVGGALYDTSRPHSVHSPAEHALGHLDVSSADCPTTVHRVGPAARQPTKGATSEVLHQGHFLTMRYACGTSHKCQKP